VAPSKSNGGSVSHRVNADGSHSIGATVDGVFVPFASLDGAYVADRVEAGKSPEAEAAAEADNTEGQ
jgi:hypothetical protein